MSSELGTIETMMADFKVLFQCLPGKKGRKPQKDLQRIRDLSLEIRTRFSRIKSRIYH